MSTYISFIVPCYNAAKYLTDLITSIKKQTINDWELLLIDDGSTDNDTRIHYIYQENGGVSNARNHGLQEAKGKYITCIDADDWIEANFIEEFSKTNLANINICGYREIYPDGKIKTECSPNSRYSNSPLDTYTVRNSYFRTPWGVVFENNFIKRNQNLSWGEDTIFLLEATIKAQNICFISNIIYNYRYTGEGLTNSPMRHINMIKFLDKYALYKEQVYPRCKNAANMINELILFLSIILLNEIIKSDKADKQIVNSIHKHLKSLPFIYILRTKIGRIRYIAAILSRFANSTFSLMIYKHLI